VVNEAELLEGVERRLSADALVEPFEEGVEIVVRDQEDLGLGPAGVVGREPVGDLESDRGLAAAFFAKDDGGRGAGEVAQDLVEVGVGGRMGGGAGEPRAPATRGCADSGLRTKDSGLPPDPFSPILTNTESCLASSPLNGFSTICQRSKNWVRFMAGRHGGTKACGHEGRHKLARQHRPGTVWIL
jgi:hypothetical protein